MGKRQTELLRLWASFGVPASAWEVLGDGRGSETNGAIQALAAGGLLESLPYAQTSDPHGGTRLRITAAGYRAIGQEPPTPAKIAAGGRKGGKAAQRPVCPTGRVGGAYRHRPSAN